MLLSLLLLLLSLIPNTPVHAITSALTCTAIPIPGGPVYRIGCNNTAYMYPNFAGVCIPAPAGLAAYLVDPRTEPDGIHLQNVTMFQTVGQPNVCYCNGLGGKVGNRNYTHIFVGPNCESLVPANRGCSSLPVYYQWAQSWAWAGLPENTSRYWYVVPPCVHLANRYTDCWGTPGLFPWRTCICNVGWIGLYCNISTAPACYATVNDIQLAVCATRDTEAICTTAPTPVLSFELTNSTWAPALVYQATQCYCFGQVNDRGSDQSADGNFYTGDGWPYINVGMNCTVPVTRASLCSHEALIIDDGSGVNMTIEACVALRNPTSCWIAQGFYPWRSCLCAPGYTGPLCNYAVGSYYPPPVNMTGFSRPTPPPTTTAAPTTTTGAMHYDNVGMPTRRQRPTSTTTGPPPDTATTTTTTTPAPPPPPPPPPLASFSSVS